MNDTPVDPGRVPELYGDGGSRRRLRRSAWVTLVVIETFAMLVSLLAPAMIAASDEPNPAPAAEAQPDETPAPAVDPSPAPAATDAPAPTPVVDPAPTVAPDPTPPAPDANAPPASAPAPAADPTAEPDPEATPCVPTGNQAIVSDKPDYAPGETVTLTGTGWCAGEAVGVFVNDTGGKTWSLSRDVTADAAGTFTLSFSLPTWFVSNYGVLATGELSGTVMTAFTDLSIGTYDQCANDLGIGYTTGDLGCRWINGDLQKNAAIYVEGDATVQRLWLTDLAPGSTHTVTFTYGTTKGGLHAYDFLTTWDWSETWITVADRCEGISGCETSSTESKFDIPQDPSVPDSFEPTASGDRQFTMRGGTLTAATTPTIVSGSYAGNSETGITVTFTVGPSTGAMCTTKQDTTTCAVALWFGAHVATQANWGLDQGAGSISGSPYHVALDAVDNAAVGQRDNQMQAGVVTIVPNGTIVIVKDAVPNDAQDFPFRLTNGSTITQDFSLDDDSDVTLPSSQTFSVPPGTWTASELNLPIEGWEFGSLTCVDPTSNTSVSGAVATIDLASNETVTCTYVNTKGGHIIVQKETTPDGATQQFEFDPSWGANFSLADGGSNDSGVLEPGTYSVAEVNLPTGWTAGTATCDDGSPVSAISLAAGETVTCTFNNSRDLGSLTISKVLHGGPSTYDPDFTIDYDCDDGTAHDGSVTLKDGGSTTITGIPTGTSCTVTEAAQPAAPTGYAWDEAPNPTYVPGQAVTIVTSPTASVAVHNWMAKIAPDDTTLTLEKALSGGPAGYTGPFTIHYDCGGTLVGDESVSVGGKATVSIPLYDGETPLTTTCTISEPTLPSVPGWAFGTPTFTPSNTHTFSTAAPAAFTITTNNTMATDLVVTKTAAGTYDRTYAWLIDKSVDDTRIEIAEGGTATFNYTVKVTPDGFTDSGWTLGGTITVTNPNAFEVKGVDVTDAFDGGGTCTVVGGTDVTIAAGGSVTLGYSCTFSTQPTYTGTNTATATWSQATYGTPTGTGSGTADVTLSLSGETDKVITVIDDKTDPLNPVTLGTWSWADGEHAFTYSLDKAGIAGTCVDYTNTAVIYETKQSDDQTVTVCVGKDLTATKTVSGTFDRTYSWLIDKSVDQTEIHIADGGTATFNYTVKVTPNGFTDSGWTAGGTITVTNPNDWEAITADVTDSYSGGGACTVTGGDAVVIAAGASVTLAYSCTFTSQPSYTGTNTATVTWDKALFFTPSGSATGTAAATLALTGETNRTITVIDDKTDPASPVTLGTSDYYAGPFEYTYALDKPGIAGTCTDYTNTAVIKETDQDDDQTVTVCVGKDLTVSKTATPTFTRTWDWTITKDYDATYHLFAGGSVSHGYKVSVTPSSTDSAWQVTGTITISNPNDWEAITAQVADVVDDAGAACTVDQAQVTVPAGDSVQVGYTCTWAVQPAKYSGLTNTATATWDATTYATPSGSAGGTAAVKFGVPTEINPVITVDDDNLTGETWSADRAYAEWTYSKDFACSADPAAYTSGTYGYSLTNTATINETGQEDTALVTVSCYAPVVSKTAAGTYDERHEWDVEKTVTPVSQSAFAGDTVSYEWKIVVTEETFEESFKVGGQVTVVNPAPMEMTVDLADALGGGTSGVIGDCTGGTYAAGKLTIPALTTATCAYTAAPGGRTDTVNTVTATLNGIAFSAPADFGWTANVIRGSVTLGDDQNPGLPQTLTDGGTFEYGEQYTCSTDKTAYDATTHSYTFGESNTAVIKDGETTLDQSSASTSVACYVPTVAKTAAGTYDEVHDWTVEKTVLPTSQTAFAGEHRDFTWTVKVGETTSGEGYAVGGTITVVNPNPEDALAVTLADQLSDGTAVALGSCTGGDLAGSTLTVPAGGTAACAYTATPTPASIEAKPTSNTVTATLNGIEFPASSDIAWTANPIDPSATLDDDQKPGWPTTVSEPTTFTYQDPVGYTCSTDPAAYTNGTYAYDESNTATLTYETGSGSATATTRVTCYAPVVTKTATTYWDRSWAWSITKDADGSYDLFPGDTVAHGYKVDVAPTKTDNLWGVKGTVTVHNPHPSAAMTLTSLVDLAGGITGNVTCESLVVPAGGDLVCTYDTGTQDKPDSNPFGDTNTATATFAGAGWTGTAAIVFSATPTTEQNPVITVDDDNLTGESWSADRAAGEWTYTKDFACSTDPAAYTDGEYGYSVTNTAKINETGQADTATVSVTCHWPQIDLTKTGDTLSKIGDGVTYTITLDNDTPTAAGQRDLACTISDPTIGFSKSVTLSSGASDTSTQAFTIPAGAADPFDNTASVTCKPVAATLPVLGSSTFSVSDSSTWSTNLFQPAVEIVKAGPSYAIAGTVITYTFTITNKSSSDSPDLTLASVSDDVLGDLEAAALAAGCDDLAPAGTCTFTATYTVPDLATGSKITNTVTVHYNPEGFPNDITDGDTHVVMLAPKSQLTDTMFCPLPDDQFRLLYAQDGATSSGAIFRLNASNPGQFYFNVFYYGTPGDTVSVVASVPWPFVTQGANPIQVHDGVTLDTAGCYAPTPALSGYTVTTRSVRPMSASGYQIVTAEDYLAKVIGTSTTPVTVTGTIPSTGLLYVTIHLDYGLKGTTGWQKVGSVAPFTAHSTFGYGDILDPQHYAFGVLLDGSPYSSNDPTSTNVFKKNAGAGGNLEKLTTAAPVIGATVLLYNSSGKLMATAVTDEDGYYYLTYKHTGKAASYSVKVPAYRLSQAITLKANGFVIVNFDTP